MFWLLKNIRKKTTFMKSKKKILILGGSGFIGCNLRKFFSNKNIDTFNIDLISKISTPDKYLDFAITNKTLKKNLAIFNLTNYINLISPNYIINLAANSHVDRSIDTPKKIIKNNLNIVINILEALRNTKKKINFIHISTDEVFGSIKKKSTNEKDYLNPSSPYSSSKAAADLIIESYIKTYKLPCSILRLSNNYGPFQNPEKFIPNSIFHLIMNKKIPIYGNGKHIREWTYVEDTCEAIYKFIINFKPFKTYNIGSSINMNNKSIAMLIIKKMKKKFKSSYKFVFDRPGHDFRYSLNSKKFRNDYKWRPRFNMKDGLNKTLKWYSINNKWNNYFLKKITFKRLGKIK